MARNKVENKQSWRPGDIKILYHPDPQVLNEAKAIQEKALEERIYEEKKKD